MDVARLLLVNSNTTLESGIYIAVFEGVEKLTTKHGPAYKFNFMIFFTEKIVSGFCPDVPLYKSRKLYNWASILSGKPMKVSQEFDLNLFRGRYVKILVSKRVKNNVESNNVENLIRLVADPYEGKKPDLMDDQAWANSRKWVEEEKKLLYGYNKPESK